MRITSLSKRIIRRIGLLILVMFILSLAVFFLARLAPGDPLQSFYGDQLDSMTQEEIDAFGLATVLAVFCVLHEERFLDRLICRIGTVFYYTPGFWLGVVLVLIFAVNLGWFPSSGAYDIGMKNDLGNRISHLVLPLFVMIASHLWYYAYMIRNKLLDEVRKDYVLLAKSKGCTRRQIVWKHCLRNVAPTIVSIMAISIPHVTGGTVVVESVFSYPGIGNLAVEAAKYHDYNLLMVDVLITGFAVFVSSFIAQTVNEEIDPRMKEMETIQW